MLRYYSPTVTLGTFHYWGTYCFMSLPIMFDPNQPLALVKNKGSKNLTDWNSDQEGSFNLNDTIQALRWQHSPFTNDDKLSFTKVTKGQ